MDKRRNKKALIITLAVLAAMIAVTAALALILRERGGARFSGAADAPYPYFWTEKKDGTIALSMETGKAEGAVWSLGGTDGDILEIAAGETKRGKSEMTLTPVEVGRVQATFTLMSGEERLAELSMTVAVSDTGGQYAATVDAHRERAFQGAVRGGEETGHPFTVRGGEEGLTIFVEDTEGYAHGGEWLFESSDTMVAALYSMDASTQGITIQLETRANGSAEASVYNADENILFVFDVEVAGGEMRLTGSRTEQLVADGAADGAEAAAAESEA